MIKRSSMLRGVFTPLVTPFIDEEVDYGKLEKNIIKYNETGLKGYMPLGSNGENVGLTEEESLKILEVVRKCKTKDKVVIAGTGRESAKATVEFIKKAASYEVDIASVITPHYFADRMNDDALIKYYVKVADESPLPVLMYNAPKFASGVTLSFKAVGILAEHPNIIAMKNSSTIDTGEYIKAVPPGTDFCFHTGNIKTFYQGLLAGATGALLSTACYLPEHCCKLYNSYLSNNLDEAKRLHNILCEITDCTAGRYGVAGVKAAMDILGFFGGNPRIPLLPLNSSQKKEMRDYFEHNENHIDFIKHQ